MARIRKEIQEILEGEGFLDYKASLLDNLFTLKEPSMEEVGVVKNHIQAKALKFVDHNCGGFGLCAMATGTGKSKIAVDYASSLYEGCAVPKILVVVPTEKLRDENWKEEFTKWDELELWDECVKRTCYASLNKIEDEEWDLVVLDECHNITEANSEFFAQNKVHRILALTATPPKDDVKKNLLKEIGVKMAFELPLDLAVKMRMVASYEIIVVETRLDDVAKNVAGGSKAKPFMTTEKANYNYLSQQIQKLMFAKDPKSKGAFKFMALRRMRMIYDLPSKTEAAKRILELIPQTERVLTFCGSIEQAETLATKGEAMRILEAMGSSLPISPHTFHSKTGDAWFNAFKAGEIDRLTCVNSLNEGHTIDGLDVALVVQLNSNELNFIQRVNETCPL